MNYIIINNYFISWKYASRYNTQVNLFRNVRYTKTFQKEELSSRMFYQIKFSVF